MSNDAEIPARYTPPAWREERVRETSLSPEQFAAKTGASTGFTPDHAKEWMMFWKEDICEKDEGHTWFPQLSLAEARRVWLAMEEHFFAKYDCFLRVWPEWCSSGIWAPPYPGSRRSGGMVDYMYLPLPDELIERFKAWQAEYDDSPPGGPHEPDWDRFSQTADELAHDLKRHVGPRIYVERRELRSRCPPATAAARTCTSPRTALVEQTLNLHQESDLLVGRGQHGDVRSILSPSTVC